MESAYSVDTISTLTEQFAQQNLYRPMRIERYEPGTELTYQVTGVAPAHKATVKVKVEKCVGGGFAGQVYQVRVMDLQQFDGKIPGLELGKMLAMKILIPPSNFSLLFRNAVYALGFQGPFQLQCNPAAARSGALWQKFIRRAAKIRFGSDNCVVDIHATFIDENLGSCGELSEWLDGRTWRLETDDHLELLKKWKKGQITEHPELGSPEYRAKHQFMHDFVNLLHDMGAHEFARQYEWSTCKSQPNCLKRKDTEDDPAAGLTAVDFRAGLALLPYLPMSPGDFKLIAKGIARGSLVQFDRGDLAKLKQFIGAHPNDFDDLQEAYQQLVESEDIYRNSIPDITHNHVRLLYSPKLWRTMFDSAVTGWRVRRIMDEQHEQKFRTSRTATFLFCLLGLIPLLGRFLRKIRGRADYRKHYGAMLSQWDYFKRTLRGRMNEKIITWLRKGRVSDEKALKLSRSPIRFNGHLILSLIPIVSLHRILTDAKFAKEKLLFVFWRPLKLLFSSSAREQWLREMVSQGQKHHLVTDNDAKTILSQLSERYIQVYLISLAVHVCTLPVTQIVSIFVAWYYVHTHPELSKAEAGAAATGILALFQVIPISPGSLARGLYVVGLTIYERRIKEYNIAIVLGFLKYIGYLAFPIQMAYRYPVLARFMAAHWATGAVNVVPVFGEKGALLEHTMFNWFYNKPLTARRRMNLRAQYRQNIPARNWHIIPITLLSMACFALVDWMYWNQGLKLPGGLTIWWLMGAVPLLAGMLATLTAGGTPLAKRIIQAAICGVMIGGFSTLARLVFAEYTGAILDENIFKTLAYRMFVLAIFAPIATILTELQLPEPEYSFDVLSLERANHQKPATGEEGS